MSDSSTPIATSIPVSSTSSEKPLDDPPENNGQEPLTRYRVKIDTLLLRLRKDNYVHTVDRLIAIVNDNLSSEPSPSNKDEYGCGVLGALTTSMCFFATVRERLTDAELLAQLSLRLMEQSSEDVQDGRTKRSDGTYLAGGELFRVYLLRACEAMFAMRMDSYGISDPSTHQQPAQDTDTEGPPAQSTPPSTFNSSVPQGPGHLRFLGELYCVGLLPARIAHECVRALLSDIKGVEDACTLLSVVGKTFDAHVASGAGAGVERQRKHVDAYFARIQALVGGQGSQKGMWRLRAKVQVSAALVTS